MVSDKQFVFIIGAPRSGSTWLHGILASHSQVASTKAELTVFSRYVNILAQTFEAEQLPIMQNKWQQGLPYLWTRAEFDKRIHWLINEIYSSLKILPEHEVILDKHPSYSFYVDTIYHYLPNAKFIHILRDGRDVAYSWQQTFYKNGFGNADYAGACLDWIHFKNSARKAQKLTPANYLEIRYENLMQNLEKELPEILSFCGINASADTVNLLVAKHSGEESMVSSPDTTVKYEDRKAVNALWAKRLSKEQTYFAKRYLGKELINEKYEKDLNWGLDAITASYFFMKSKTLTFFRIMKRVKRVLSVK